ncbi:hypothetical protein AB0E01_14795 [Nocardia vinacea]|uniref:hypothetical protein n=1 Tax=Nocardia vinacea TaxID=96468 RepID=UPI00340E8DD6
MKRHFAIAVVTALAAAATAAITSGSAYAGTALSLQLCHGNQISTYVTPDPLAVVNGQPISYGDPWHDSMPVRDGDVVRLRASGSIKVDSWPWGPSFGPSGSDSDRLSTFWGNADFPEYGFYGYFVATEQAFWIGDDSGCVTYHGPDTSLWLAQNDDNTTDNSGRWDIGISHYGL